MKMPDFSKEKAILPLVAAMLAITYLYFTYVFRPSNPVAFPDVEGRMWTVLLIFLIASALAYAREIFGVLENVFGKVINRLLGKAARHASSMLEAARSRFCRLDIYGKAAHHTSRLHAHLKDKMHPAVWRHASSMLEAARSRFCRLDIYGKAAHHTSRLHAHLRDNVHPAVRRHASRIASRVPRIGAHHVATPVAKLFSFLSGIAAKLLPTMASVVSRILGAVRSFQGLIVRLAAIVFKAAYNFFARVNEVAAMIISHVLAHMKKYFARGKPNYFATLGLAVFLILSPLVIYNQKELAEPAVAIFIAYIALSYWKKLDDRVMIVAALLFLLTCPFLLIMKENARAELAAIYAYYALCAGVFLQFVDYVQHRDKYDAEEIAKAQQDDNGRNDGLNDKRVQEVEEGCFRIDLPFGKG